MSKDPKIPHELDRRTVLHAAAVGVAGSSLGGTRASAEPGRSEYVPEITPQPAPNFGDEWNTADIIVETLISWGATHAFGVVGDGINSVIEALRKRQDRIRYIGVRHEEAAAFMACGIAKHSGKLGVCIGTTGPGAIHLLNGLYDAAFDGAPVIAITGTTFHDLIGTRYQQSVDTTRLMQDVALYNVEVTGPQHAILVANRACRAAIGDRGVAHLTIAKDVQMMKLSADKRSMANPGARTSSSWSPAIAAPPKEQIRAAADLLNSGRKVAILAGQGALQARSQLTQLADLLAAPVARSLLGRAVLADDSPYSVGGIGNLGTTPSQWAMKNCDSVLILGSTMPWIQYYPTPGQARGIQVDLKPDRIGLRFPVEVGLTGDVRLTLEALIPLISRKEDRSFLQEAQRRMVDWNQLIDGVERSASSPLRPQTVVRALSDLANDDALISLDCGANTYFAARHFRLRANQHLTGTGMLASMGPGMSFAIAGQLAFPKRQSLAIVGDGGFAQLMAELSTAVAHDLPIKVIVLKNNSLSEVRYEQMEIGSPEYGCSLSPIDFVAFARACGADGFRCERGDEVRTAIEAALRSSKAALVEAVVTDEKPSKPEEVKS